MERNFSEMIVEAVVYEKDDKVWIAKYCPTHGVTREVYWEDAAMYHFAERFADRGLKLHNPHIEAPKARCPLKCGLCEEHESHTGLANIVVTNRCNLTCWYCFFYAKEGGRIYEPSLERIKRMLAVLRSERPVGAEAVQLTGGEPTLREDLTEIIAACREAGFQHILLNTNGIELSRNLELMRRVKEAGKGGHIILYMSFDGVTPETNPKNYYEVPGVIRNARIAGMSMVLVPTVIRGRNDHELGDIIRFAFGNLDVVRGVNFQPVSLVGRMPRREREKQRITIPGVIKAIEEQTDGVIAREDFFPVPSTARLTSFMEAIFSTPKYRLSTHFACGMATYAFKQGSTLVPITRFFDVEGFLEFLQELSFEVEHSRFKLAGRGISIIKALANISRFIDEEKKPPYLDLKRVLISALTRGSYAELKELNRNSLFIGMMHFQDTYNYDIARVRKCCVHYALPDLRVVPFCSFNVLPELYRDRVQERFSIPVKEWEARTGRKLADDRYVRSFTEEEKKEVERFYRESIARAGF
ncbi:MAG: radical SAM protein [Euryarchaeota archaeon]|nr:radical SAM protein [Euryarchaeota archaeon]